jgi:DNA repair exonuclease SbcCD ATPase subunit
VSLQSEKSMHRKKCKSIISAVAGVEELSPKIRETLSDLVRHSLGLENGLPSQYRDAALAMVREALASTEKRLEEELQKAQSKVDSAQEDKVAREAAVTHAERHVHDLQNAILESKVAIKESNTSIGTSRKSLKVLQGAQRSSQEKLNALATKVEQLHSVEQSAYQPLKEAAAQGREGHAQLKCIRKLGKDFGFHETLLESVPGVLKRALDKRQTFDGLVMSQLEREFMKHYTDMETKLNDGGKELQEHTHAVQEAQALLDESGKTLEESSQRLSEAMVALSPSRKVRADARQNVRRFDSDLQKLVRESTQAQCRLDAFRCGPLAAFQELQKQASTVSVAARDEKAGVVSSETSNESSSLCTTLAQPTVLPLDKPASLGMTCTWLPTETQK